MDEAEDRENEGNKIISDSYAKVQSSSIQLITSENDDDETRKKKTLHQEPTLPCYLFPVRKLKPNL